MTTQGLGWQSELVQMSESNTPTSSAKKVADMNSFEQLRKQAKEKEKRVCV